MKYSARNLASLPLHCKPTCLSNENSSAGVLIGFPQGKIGLWRPDTGEYFLRSFQTSVSDSEVVAVACGVFPSACALFSDTTILTWDVVTGEVRQFINHNRIAEEEHAMAVAAANARRDEFGTPASMSDEYLLESEPTQYSIDQCLLRTRSGFVYSLIEPGIDSWGVHVVNMPRLIRWSDGESGPEGLVLLGYGDWVKLRRGPGDDAVLVVAEHELMLVNIASGEIVQRASFFLENESPFIDAVYTNAEDGSIRLITGSEISQVNSTTFEKLRSQLKYRYLSEPIFMNHGDRVLLRMGDEAWSIAQLDQMAINLYAIQFSQGVELLSPFADDSNELLAVYADGTISLVALDLVEEVDVPF